MMGGGTMARSVDEMMDFFLYEKGEVVKINDTENRALIVGATDKIKWYDDKMIRMKREMKTGDIVEYQGSHFIIISQIVQTPFSYKGRMRKCNQQIIKENPGEEIIIGYDFRGFPIYEFGDPILLTFTVIIENVAIDVASNQPIVLLQNEVMVTIQDNEFNRSELVEGEEVQIMGRKYNILGVDRFKSGLLILKCSLYGS